MYLKSFTIKQVKCFGEGVFDFPARVDGRYAGWHVLLGANATGKTTALQAMAVCLLGPSAWAQLLAPVGWVRQGATDAHGTLEAEITKGPRDGAERDVKGPFSARVFVTPDRAVDIEREPHDTPQFVLSKRHRSTLAKGVYATKKRGWFACGYGPFRRLYGGSSEATANLSQARQLRCASLFRESVALTQCEPWMRDLHHRAHDDASPDRRRDEGVLEVVREVVDSLLPGGVKLGRVSASGVTFVTTTGRAVALADLSDGYRSFLALCLDILRHLVEADGQDFSRLVADVRLDGHVQKQVLAEGVVLIDEVDAHLHPSWQRRIGRDLQRVFPNVQFIVSSHSPFIAQEASPGGIFVLRADETEDGVTVAQPLETVRGWRADAILTSDLFGLDDTVDLETEALVGEYRALSSKRSFGKLSPTERKRLDRLEAELSRSLTAPGESVEEFRRRMKTEAYIEKTLKGLDEAG
jgi:hypothetical protein